MGILSNVFCALLAWLLEFKVTLWAGGGIVFLEVLGLVVLMRVICGR